MSPSQRGSEEFSDPGSRLERLSPEQLVRINQWCDQYERLWKERGAASFEIFLPQIENEDRAEVIYELILIDIELRQNSALTTSAEDYLRACPNLDRDWLHQQLAISNGPSRLIAANGLTAGQRIGDYTIIEPLGSGGMGSVYRAEHVLMKRPVALKIIQHQFQSNVVMQRRFEREVRAIAKLSHPNVVTAFDARQNSGWLYLVTELIEGVDLGALVRKKGRLSALKAAHYAWQAAKGLHYAHGKGIIHRDIKPENLLLDPKQQVKVLDLGLSRLAFDESEPSSGAAISEANQLIGTAGYMSPEQARACATADARSDIYSLGCTLFFLLTGRPPYACDSMVATLLAHVHEPIPSVSDYLNGANIPPSLEELVHRMMAKDPGDRPASMNEVIAGLTAIIKQLQGTSQQLIQPTSVEPKSQPVTLKNNSMFRKENLIRSAIAVASFLLLSYLVSTLVIPRVRNAGPSWSNDNGLSFNGVDRFVEIQRFNEPIADFVAIEAVVRADAAHSPSNVVSWTGPKCLTLFRTIGNEWGTAFFDGTTPHLIVGSHAMGLNEEQLVAATWDGVELGLYVNGKQVEAYPIDYQMVSAPQKLFIGGIPDGIIPSQQGTRYFNGQIAMVRISRSTKPLKLASDPSQLVLHPATLALFDFRLPTYASTVDLTSRWRAHLRGNYLPGDALDR